MPGPAMVIALIALFVALGGTTYAVTGLPRNSVGTAQLKNRAVTRKKLNKKTIAALKGERGPRGLTGSPGSRGPQGVQGIAGKNGTAVAYAHILADGTLDAANSKNVSASTSPHTGDYCLKVTVPVLNMDATVDVGTSGVVGFADGAVAAEDPTGLLGIVGCPTGYNALIVVDTSSGFENAATWAVFN